MIGKVVVSLALAAAGATAVRSAAPDPDTRAWWALASELSSDAMEGRDAGSAGYDRAARKVAARFAAAGLKPLGPDGSWLQSVPMHEVAIEAASVSVAGRPLRFLHDFTVQPSPATPARLSASLVYGGYCAAGTLGDVTGKIVLCHGVNRDGLPSGADRSAAAKAAGAVGIITIADPGFTVEPPRWPFAYARAVWLAGSPPASDPMLRMTLNADALAGVIAGSGKDARTLIAAGSAGRALPRFEVKGELVASFTLRQRDLTSSNVLGMLPGTDPSKANQAIVLSAHLDGYGFGEPVNGDRLYNGTLDDAAYVALLIRLAEARHGRGFRRPIIFAAFTGEEKGLLGSRWFVQHPIGAKSSIAANINLDQLRPIFPLKLLTVHALDDTSLGDDARAVAAAMGIAVQRDPEPERNLLRRADQWPFLQAGIPATAFVFGYRPGTESEKVYRQWYRTGYHRPQDDPRQFIDWKAAGDFNRFFFALVARVADQESAPGWKPESPLRPAAVQ
jgi:hypothetical protein